MNPILKNEELNNNRKEEELTKRVESTDKPTATCTNGVCMVSWKPQRPAAA